MTGALTDLAVLVEKPGSWVERGSCVGTPLPDLWFADDRGRPRQDGAPRNPDLQVALDVCRGCAVRSECLAYALTVDDAHDWGVWGGTTQEAGSVTEQEYILARLQVEREQQIARWAVPGPQHTRVEPRAARRAVDAVHADQERRMTWRGAAA